MSKPKPPADFDENPVWTEDMHAKARPASEVHGARLAAKMVRKPGRPAGSKNATTKAQISLRVDGDVLAIYKAGGPGWQTRMNEDLRKAAEKRA